MSAGRNRNALVALLFDLRLDGNWLQWMHGKPTLTRTGAEALADQLLELGPVLVPAALTNEDTATLFDVPESHGPQRRESLEEVARDG